jgi:hypothetical protein
MGRIEDLAAKYQRHIAIPWQRNLSGDQKTIFIVYPKSDERQVRVRMDTFAMATAKADHTWKLVDLTPVFAEWMAAEDYREEYFEDPGALEMSLEHGFTENVADRIRAQLLANDVTEDSVVAVLGAGSLFGLTRLSLVLRHVINDVRGRLLLFFPGEYDNSNYRLLDARDGWNYLAVPITLHDGVTDQ